MPPYEIMKDHKKCKHCENDNTNPYFCDFCGRPVHERMIVHEKEKEVTQQTQEKA